MAYFLPYIDCIKMKYLLYKQFKILDCCLLSCDTIYSCKWIRTFRRKMLPLFSGSKCVCRGLVTLHKQVSRKVVAQNYGVDREETILTAPPLFTLTVWGTIAAFICGSVVVSSMLLRLNWVSKLSFVKKRLNLLNKSM
jgi:hypothetical protein